MSLLHESLESINESTLQALINNGVRENHEIEYKREVSLKRTDDKHEFLADVTAFANARGGDIVIGIECDENDKALPIGKPEYIEGNSLDDEKQAMENLLRDCIEPRLPHIIHAVMLENGKVAVVIRVPWSWAQPHMVKLEKSQRFYYRTSVGKEIMSIDQIRDAFSMTSSLMERSESLATSV